MNKRKEVRYKNNEKKKYWSDSNKFTDSSENTIFKLTENQAPRDMVIKSKIPKYVVTHRKEDLLWVNNLLGRHILWRVIFFTVI